MCKKLLILCFALVVIAMSTPVSAAPSGTTPLKIDLNGNAWGNQGRTQPGWSGWDFEQSPTTNTFIKNFTVGGDKVQVELKGIKNDGSNPGSRMRDAQTTYKLGNVHEDLFFVATTASAVGLHGLDYISVKYSLGSAQANKTFTVWAFAWDSAYGTANDPDMDDYAAWGVVNPSTNGGYLDAGNANVPVLGRHLMQGPKQNDPNVNWDTYMSAFDVTADGTGVITVYGWFDGGWQGSYHMPISGIVLLPEPTTVALLGLGGLALLRRRK